MKKFGFLLAVLLLPGIALANVGVGIGNGKIEVNEPLKAGAIYQVPSVTVLNTGDVASEYEMDITYHVEQTGMWPEKKWFKFSPNKFDLEPGGAQIVEVRLDIPVKVTPGDYFAFIEAHPVVQKEGGVTRINVAAACKFYFSVAPANIFQGIYYRTLALFTHYSPWSYIVFAVVVFAILTVIFRKKFKLNLRLSIDKK